MDTTLVIIWRVHSFAINGKETLWIPFCNQIKPQEGLLIAVSSLELDQSTIFYMKFELTGVKWELSATCNERIKSEISPNFDPKKSIIFPWSTFRVLLNLLKKVRTSFDYLLPTLHGFSSLDLNKVMIANVHHLPKLNSTKQLFGRII